MCEFSDFGLRTFHKENVLHAPVALTRAHQDRRPQGPSWASDGSRPLNWLRTPALRRVAQIARQQDKSHARQARRARRRRPSAAAAPTPRAAPAPQTAPPVARTDPLPAPRRAAVAPGSRLPAARLAGRLGGALRRGVPPGPAPRRHPLPRWSPGLRQRRPRRGPPPHPRPGAAPARRVLPHRGPPPPDPGREGAPKIQGHRHRAEDGHVAACSCCVHRAERGAVQSRVAEQRGGLRPVRRRRVRVAVPRRLLARLRHRLPRRHRLPTRRDPTDQVAWVLELSQRRRAPARRGAGELDGDVLLRLHPVPGEPRTVARLTAVRRRRRRRGRRPSSSVVTPFRGTSPWRHAHMPSCSINLEGFQTVKRKTRCTACMSLYSTVAGLFRHSEFSALRGAAKCPAGCWDHAKVL